MLRIPKKKGMLFFDGLYSLEEVDRDEDGSLSRIALLAEGKDNGQQAAIRKTIQIQGDGLVFRKEVRYAGTEEFFVRNEYLLKRSR